MKKIILAVACFGVMGACFADDITIRLCDSKNRQECTFGTYGATVVKLAEREAVSKSNSLLPTTIDTTEETGDFEIKEEKPEETPATMKVVRGVGNILTGGWSEVALSVVGKD